MKKILLCCAMLFMATIVIAQTLNIHFKNGTKIEFESATVDYVDFSEALPDPTISSGDYVDLGLPSGTLWATCNVGASSPTEFGNKYAWGETTTKGSYKLENYAYYNSNTQLYTDIGSDIAGTSFDAATVNLGSNWRMPTASQMKELYNNCTWTWVVADNVPGYKITGSTGNSIFLASEGTGYFDYTYFWTSTMSSASDDSEAKYAFFGSSSYVCMDAFWGAKRYRGYYIRPIYVH